MTGRPHTAAHRAKISAALRGHEVSAQTRRKMSASQKLRRQRAPGLGRPAWEAFQEMDRRVLEHAERATAELVATRVALLGEDPVERGPVVYICGSMSNRREFGFHEFDGAALLLR